MSHDDVAIRVSNVSKAFKLPHEKNSSLKSLFVGMFNGRRTYETQQVLKDVSFEIKKGEFIGIVGRNGSGKSTLLKLLSRIYTPDKGEIFVNGKLTPFIELGVGFNPELTGRENVFLNGALLGFNREEMQDMYAEIVEFAELEKFMDQKLKNYSSGMQVRLAFSIAIRANTDILVLDEVLAVGDEAFQRKCNEYFKSVKEDKTKTVVLVTHSMDAVRRFCDRAIMIRDGSIVVDGSPEDVTNEYTQENLAPTRSKKKNDGHEDGLSDKVPYFKVVTNSKKVLTHNDTLSFDIEYEITDTAPILVFFSIIDEWRGFTVLANGAAPISGKGRHKLTYNFPLDYYNDADISVHAVLDEAETKRRVAFTNESNSARVAIRNKESDNGLLRKDNDIHGGWVNHEEFIYNLKSNS